MRTLSNRWVVPGVAGVLACLMAAGCTSAATPAAAPPSQPASTSADVPASGPASSSPTPTASSSASTPVGVQNLLVSPSVRRELTAAYVAYWQSKWHFKPSGFAGTAPGSVYYAYAAATGTYWAMATFQQTAAAAHSSPGSPMFNTTVDMQDGGNQGLFMKDPGSAWVVQFGGVPPQCKIIPFFPKAVIKARALSLARCPADG